MPTLEAYLTAAAYKERRTKLGGPGGADEDGRETDAAILIDLQADAELIDSWSYRTFHRLSEDTKRWSIPATSYDGLPGRRAQYIGDYATISAVTLDGVALVLDTDYTLRRARDNERFPYAWIEFDGPTTGALRVTGERGWEEVPSLVVATNAEMTAIRRFESPQAWVNRDTGEDATSQLAQKLFMLNMRGYVRDQAVQIGFG